MTKSPRVWIIDGHNLIFQVPHLEELQSSGHRKEARKRLEAMLSALARKVGERMTVVYDGNRMERNPDMVDEEDLQTVYALPPEEADDRVVYLCERYLKEGFRVRVVTSDLRTLKERLPAGISHLTAEELQRRFLAATEREEKEVRGDFSDIEEELVRRAEVQSSRGRTSAPRKDVPPGAPPTGVPPPGASPPAPPPSRRPLEEARPPSLAMPPMSEEAREALLRKKERGRRRQERRQHLHRKSSGSSS